MIYENNLFYFVNLFDLFINYQRLWIQQKCITTSRHVLLSYSYTSRDSHRLNKKTEGTKIIIRKKTALRNRVQYIRFTLFSILHKISNTFEYTKQSEAFN